MGLAVLKTPARVPQANTFCERLIGTIRRECLDFVIRLTERHLRATLREWTSHYNRGRPHSSLGPGLPDAPSDSAVASNVINCPIAVASSRRRFWAGFIMNIGSRRRRERRYQEYLQTTGVASLAGHPMLIVTLIGG
jgi:Integrase core domain